MIDLESFKILKRNKSTLKETSKRKNDGLDLFMTESNLEVVDFDAVKLDYTGEIASPYTPTSSDALFIDDNGECFLIEFKDGFIDNKVSYEIWLKMLDSLLILTDILENTVSFTRKKLNFILVYNEGKNPLPEGVNEGMQVSASRVTIAEYFIEKKSKKRFIRFNLERFDELYFVNVFTYNQSIFESEFILKKTS